MAVLRKMFVAMYYMLRDKKYYKYSDEKNHNKKLNEYNDFLSKYEKKIFIRKKQLDFFFIDTYRVTLF